MMSAIVPLWSYPSCRKLYNNKLSRVHMCAGGLGTDTCQVNIVFSPVFLGFHRFTNSCRVILVVHFNAVFLLATSLTDNVMVGSYEVSLPLVKGVISTASLVFTSTFLTRASLIGSMIGKK